MKLEFEDLKYRIRTMPFKSVVREIRESIGNLRRKGEEGRPLRHPGKSHIAPEQPPCSSSPSLIPQSRWASLPTELIVDIIQRVESSETSWPGRRDVVACASVCKSWREIAKGVVKTPEKCGLLTFPISLKQPGPRETPIQCFIRRDRSTSTYRLYLGLSPGLSGNMSKLLLAGRKVRRATHTDFMISLVADDFSRACNTYVGKLRSNFMGTKFSIYDSQPALYPTMQTTSSSQRRGHLKRVSRRVTIGEYNVSSISYELNVLRTRGPRRMQCTMNSIPVSSIQEGGTAPTPTEFIKCLDQKHDPPLTVANKKKHQVEFSVTSLSEPLLPVHSPLVLKNKAPRWHEQLQCWCLNFRGRVTVASVKNFQLVASADVQQNISASEQEKVILQFGKIGKNIFTMDYRYPLSTFQAFAICLSSFDTKPACE